jgi:hypothetical protein
MMTTFLKILQRGQENHFFYESFVHEKERCKETWRRTGTLIEVFLRLNSY